MAGGVKRTAGALNYLNGLQRSLLQGVATLTGANVFTAANTFSVRQSVKAFQSPQNNLGSVFSGTVTFDVSVAGQQKLSVGGNLIIATSGWPASGTYGELEIQLVTGGGHTITWPAAVHWYDDSGGNSTTFPPSMTLSSSDSNVVILWTTDGGFTIYGKIA